MAKVEMPLLSGAVRGKFGNVVFFRRWGTDIARVRVKPSNPKTFKQQIVRHNLASLSGAFTGSGKYVAEDAEGKFVILKRYDVNTNTVENIRFPVLTDTEKMQWQEYAYTTLKKPKAFGRLAFVGENARRLMMGMTPIRLPQ